MNTILNINTPKTRKEEVSTTIYWYSQSTIIAICGFAEVRFQRGSID
jgi:hypothetical protein